MDIEVKPDLSSYITAESDPIVKAINGIVKSNGTTIAAVVSGTDIKTINSGSVLGSGNIALQTPLTAGTDYARILRGTFTDADLASGILTITHNWNLPANYGVIFLLTDPTGNSYQVPNIGSANSVAVDLSLLIGDAPLSGTWSYEVIG
jgi:hypothetical protein